MPGGPGATSTTALETAVAALPQALDYTGIKSISCGYGSNQTYTITSTACKIHWITLWHQYNTKQWSYLRNAGSTVWYFSHMPTQYKPYHLKFDPPLVFSGESSINMAAMGRALICYKETA